MIDIDDLSGRPFACGPAARTGRTSLPIASCIQLRSSVPFRATDRDRVDVHRVRVPLGLPLRWSSWRFAATTLAGAQITASRMAQDLQAGVDDAGLLVVWQRVAACQSSSLTGIGSRWSMVQCRPFQRPCLTSPTILSHHIPS